jgi:O-antigen/teichoic acid export membrane protein
VRRRAEEKKNNLRGLIIWGVVGAGMLVYWWFRIGEWVGSIPVETLLWIIIAVFFIVVPLWGFVGGLLRRQREWREMRDRHRETE